MNRQIAKLANSEKVRIPASFDFMGVRGLRKESALKLSELKPMTLGQAGRISGICPADVALLLVYLESPPRREAAGCEV